MNTNTSKGTCPRSAQMNSLCFTWVHLWPNSQSFLRQLRDQPLISPQGGSPSALLPKPKQRGNSACFKLFTIALYKNLCEWWQDNTTERLHLTCRTVSQEIRTLQSLGIFLYFLFVFRACCSCNMDARNCMETESSPRHLTQIRPSWLHLS